jgi:hypothetical protein
MRIAISQLIEAIRRDIAIISACAEHGADKLLLPDACLSDDFLRLSTQVVGPERVRGKFRDFLIEANRGNTFRAFENRDQAEGWLTAGD